MTDYSNQNITGQDLSGVNLTGANFTNTNATNVNFTNATITNAIFKNTLITGANISTLVFSDFQKGHLLLRAANQTIAAVNNLTSLTPAQFRIIQPAITADTITMIQTVTVKIPNSQGEGYTTSLTPVINQLICIFVATNQNIIITTGGTQIRTIRSNGTVVQDVNNANTTLNYLKIGNIPYRLSVGNGDGVIAMIPIDLNVYQVNGSGLGDIVSLNLGSGATGPTGVAGPAGAVGAQGTAGAAGAAGVAGSTGPTGAVGAQGTAGAAGVAGVAGSTGPTGAVGAQGTAGAAGVAGVAGSTGPTGAVGAQGTAGAAGVAGVAGSTGPTGIAGYATALTPSNTGIIPIMTAATTSGFTISATSEYNSDFAAWKASDNLLSTDWAMLGTPFPCIWKVQCPTQFVIWKIEISKRYGGAEFITSFYFEGSNDDNTWTSLAYSTGQMSSIGSPPSMLTVLIKDSTYTSYSYFRLRCLTGTGTNPGINTFQMYAYSNTTLPYIGPTGPSGISATAPAAYGTYRLTDRGTVGDYTLNLLQGSLSVSNSTFVSLIAGSTYELTADVAVRCSFAAFSWQTEGGVILGNSGQSFSTNSNDPGAIAPAYAVFTPSVNTRVKLRLTSISGYTLTSVEVGQISIKEMTAQGPAGSINSVSSSDSSITTTTTSGAVNLSIPTLLRPAIVFVSYTTWATDVNQTLPVMDFQNFDYEMNMHILNIPHSTWIYYLWNGSSTASHYGDLTYTPTTSVGTADTISVNQSVINDSVPYTLYSGNTEVSTVNRNIYVRYRFRGLSANKFMMSIEGRYQLSWFDDTIRIMPQYAGFKMNTTYITTGNNANWAPQSLRTSGIGTSTVRMTWLRINKTS
jgi:uncharacterized protein YjbI with pentapeptide repeats